MSHLKKLCMFHFGGLGVNDLWRSSKVILNLLLSRKINLMVYTCCGRSLMLKASICFEYIIHMEKIELTNYGNFDYFGADAAVTAHAYYVRHNALC